jgi:hypothetical protein
VPQLRSLVVYFFRRRLALATARLCQGVRIEVMGARLPAEISFIPDAAAASTFSLTIRRYSAGEQLFCIIISVRRVIVSHDDSIKSAIIAGSGTPLRRLRVFMLRTTYSSPAAERCTSAGGVISVVAKSPGMMISIISISSDQS